MSSSTPEVAARQMRAERPTATAKSTEAAAASASPSADGAEVEPVQRTLPRRFYSRKTVDPVRLVRDAGDIAEAIVQQLRWTPGAEVKVVIEVEGQDQAGFAEDVQRTVAENARTLKFDEHEFSDGS